VTASCNFISRISQSIVPKQTTMLRSILIVEDEEIIRNSLAEFLTDEGYDVAMAGNVAAALRHARQRDFQVAICDVQLPDGDGLELLRRLQQFNANISGLIITAYATVENAVEAFKSGAFDYLVKPVIFDDVANKLKRLFQYRELSQENQSLRRELAQRDKGDSIVGSSKSVREVQEAVRRVAVTNANVLLVGESGTGKQLVARTIHKWGPKQAESFIAINCATRPTELLEAQLFGAKAGSVAGVSDELSGGFRQAGSGTLYLDEIAHLPLAAQDKLLRAIEYQEFTPVGASNPLRSHARIIAATTRDLNLEVSEGRFQEDLFYRLDGLKIRIPPLRERLDDIPELIESFIARHSRAMGQRVTGVTSEAIRALMSAPWKGNVRQLDNAIERAVMMCDGAQIRLGDLPPDLRGGDQPLPDTDDLRSAIRHYERLHIVRVLSQWPDKREAAKRLKLGLSSLYRKIEELGIDL
jgi:DNA-binding NtrC family response regulator